MKFVIVFLFQLIIYSTAIPKDIRLNNQSVKEFEVSEYQILLLIKNTAFYEDISINTSLPGYNNQIQNEEISRKSPWLAFGLSYLFPGLGQLYNGEYLKAILFPTFFCLGAAMMVYSSPGADFEGQKPSSLIYVGLGVAGGSYLWNLIDAPVSANRINEQRLRQEGTKIISFKTDKYVLSFNSDNFCFYKLQLSINF